MSGLSNFRGVNSNLETSKCRYCDSPEESVAHILFECPMPKRREARAQHLQVYVADSKSYTEFYSIALIQLILDDVFNVEIFS